MEREMPSFSEPVSMEFIALTVGIIFAFIAVGIFFVKKFKS